MSRQYDYCCQSCRRPMIEYRHDGRTDIRGLHVTIDPTRDEGVVAIVTCLCGTVKEWVVRGRTYSTMNEKPLHNAVH